MSYHYIKKYYGDNCSFQDSSWKRMQRYNASHGDTAIFNFGCGYGSNLYSNSCYGGGSFWGGFGAGLGHGLANFACGIISGLFGGFMGGFGMPMFGMPMMFNNYGMVPNYVGFGGIDNATKAGNTGKADKKEETDKADEGGNGGTKTEIEKLTEIAKSVNESTPIEDIDKLIKEIDTAKEKDGVTDSEKTELEKTKTKLENTKVILELKNNSKTTVDNDELDNLIKAAKENILSNYEKTALKNYLEKDLKYLKDREEGFYKCSQDVTELKKLELLNKVSGNCKVKVEYYEQGSDKWIKGPISNVKENNSGNYTYNIDCTNTGEIGINAVWTMEQYYSSDEIKLRPIATTYHKGYNTDVYYNWDAEKKCWVNNTGKATAKP